LYWLLNCYVSIKELPVVVWFEINETQNLKLLYRYKGAFGFGLINLNKVWEKIYDEYISVIGLNKEYLEYLESVIQLAQLECDCILDPTPINKVERLMMIEDMKKKKTSTKQKYNDIIAQVSKANGGIPLWKVTVVEFYSIMNNLNGK